MKEKTLNLFFVFKMLMITPFLFLPVYLQSIGILGSRIGILMGVFSVAGLFVTLPIGITNDLINPKRLIMISFIIIGAMFAILGHVSTFALLFLVFVILASSSCLAESSIKALIYKTTSENNKGTRFALVAFHEFAGVALGTVVGGFLLVISGYNSVFTICGLLFIVSLLLVRKLPSAKTVVFQAVKYKREFLKKEVILFSVIMFLYAYHFGTEATTFTIFLKNEFMLDNFMIGLFIGIVVWVLALSSLYYGRFLDIKKLTLYKLIFFGLCISAVSHILFALSTTIEWAFFFRIIHEAGDASCMVFIYVMTSSLFSKSRIGGGAGFIAQVIGIGSLIGAVTSGFLMQAYGPRVPIIVASVLSLAAVAIVWVNRTYLDRHHH